MKKVISLLILACLMLSLGIAATGCKGSEDGGNNASGGGDYADAVPGGNADVGVEVMEALTNSGTISMYMFEDNPSIPGNRSEWFDSFLEYYGQVYNGKVDVIDTLWADWYQKFITDFAADSAPDLIYLFENNFPKFANRGMVVSIEEMQSKGVVGFDHPALMSDRDLIYDSFKYKDGHFGFAKNLAEADMLFVNNDLFKQYDVKSPVEYYNEGQWNWQNFEKCAAAMTRDTDGDGANDIFGYYGWDGNFIITAAGGQLVTLGDDGMLAVGMDSIATQQGIDNYANIYGKLKAAAPYEGSKCAMWAHMATNEYTINEAGHRKGYDWSVVPFPLDDRTNAERVRSGKSYAWSVSSTAANPQGCVNFIIALNSFEDITPNPAAPDYSKYFTEDEIQMINDNAREAVVPLFHGTGNLWQQQWDFWGAIQTGKKSAAEIVTTFKPMFEAQVKLENLNSTN